jgi:hypothetical protein
MISSNPTSDGNRSSDHLDDTQALAAVIGSTEPSQDGRLQGARNRPRLVGTVVTLRSVGSVAGPIMIGWLAEATSLRT